MAGLLNFFFGKKDDNPLPATPPPLPRYHIRLLLCEQSVSRPHVFLYDSLTPCRHKNVAVPMRLLDYPTPIMLSEMMFGSMPIKCQSDGLKVYCIHKDDTCKAVFIKLFCADVEADTGDGRVAKIRCKTQFAFAVVFSVLSNGDAKAVDGSGRLGEAPEIGLLLAHFSFVEVQLGELLQACSDAIAQYIANQCSGQMELLVRAKLPSACLQEVEPIRAAAKSFMENLLIFLNPHPLVPAFFGVQGDGSMVVNNTLAKTGRYFTALCDLLEALDAPQANFLVSAAITAILTHHLTWLLGVAKPVGEGDSLDVNAVCSMVVNTLYGVCGPAGKYTKVVLVGPDSKQMETLVEILSYFVRCGSVIQRVDGLDDNDFLCPPARSPDQHSEPSLFGDNNGGATSLSSGGLSSDGSSELGALAQTLVDQAGGKEVPFPRFHTQSYSETQSQHCYSARTSCLTVPFVMMRPPLASQPQRTMSTHPKVSFCSSGEYIPMIPNSKESFGMGGMELRDDDLIALCRDPVVCRSYDGVEDDPVAGSAVNRCQCVVVNLFSKLCYVAHVEHTSPVEGQTKEKGCQRLHVSRRVVSPSDFIHQTLHQLRVWKRHLRMRDVDLFQYLDAQLYTIYQHSVVLRAIVESGCPEKLSYQLIGSILGVSTSHIPLVLAVAMCYDPSIKTRLPDPPLVTFTPSSRLETLVESIF